MSDEVGPAFVDTNVVVYAYDAADRRKQAIASKLVPALLESGRLRLSVQVLREFYVTVTRKIARPMSAEDALSVLDDLEAGEVLTEDGVLVRHAAELQTSHRLSFWDALILAAAIRAGAETLYSEDLNGGEVVEGVRIVNPFAQ